MSHQLRYRPETGRKDNMDGRDSKGRFTKGNPGGGRKKTPEEFSEALQSQTSQALATIVSLMKNPNTEPGIRLKACIYIIDRTYGKPTQMLASDLQNEDDYQAIRDMEEALFGAMSK